jgi:hypothetical protein
MGLFLASLGAILVILAACGIGGTVCWILGWVALGASVASWLEAR